MVKLAAESSDQKFVQDNLQMYMYSNDNHDPNFILTMTTKLNVMILS